MERPDDEGLQREILSELLGTWGFGAVPGLIAGELLIDCLIRRAEEAVPCR